MPNMTDEGETFESADAGSALVYPMAAGELRKGSHVMIKEKPCKVTEITSSKTGKHGHAKCHIVALDIFTSKKYEDLCPASHNMSIPFVKRIELQCLTADLDTGEVSLLMEDGSTKDDLNLPTFVKVGEPTDEDKKITAELVAAVEDGSKDVMVAVLQACGEEKIVGFKLTEQK